MEKDSIIVLSGGMDSVTLLHEYKRRISLAVSFDYGSNHNAREIECAQSQCRSARCRKAKAIPPSTRLTSDDTASPQSLWLDTPEPKAYLKS